MSTALQAPSPQIAGGYSLPGSVIAWTCSPLLAQASAIVPSGGAGVMFLFQMTTLARVQSTAFNMFVTTAGSVLANVFAAAIDTSGNIIGQTANRAADAALVTSNALWSPPWITPFTPAQATIYGVLLIGSATTMPTFTCATNRLNSLANLGTSAPAGNLRVATSGSALSALPASPISMAGLSSNQNAFWAALT